MKNFELLIGIGLGAAIAGAALSCCGKSDRHCKKDDCCRCFADDYPKEYPIPRRVRVPLRSVFVGSLLFPSEKRTAKEERPLQRVLLREVRKKVVQISFGRSRESAPPLHALIFYRKFLFIKSENRSSVVFRAEHGIKTG